MRTVPEDGEICRFHLRTRTMQCPTFRRLTPRTRFLHARRSPG